MAKINRKFLVTKNRSLKVLFGNPSVKESAMALSYGNMTKSIIGSMIRAGEKLPFFNPAGAYIEAFIDDIITVVAESAKLANGRNWLWGAPLIVTVQKNEGKVINRVLARVSAVISNFPVEEVHKNKQALVELINTGVTVEFGPMGDMVASSFEKIVDWENNPDVVAKVQEGFDARFSKAEDKSTVALTEALQEAFKRGVENLEGAKEFFGTPQAQIVFLFMQMNVGAYDEEEFDELFSHVDKVTKVPDVIR